MPATQGTRQGILKDAQRNLVVCPLPYDGSFMEVFYTAWHVVRQFIAADAHLPKPVALWRPVQRQVARDLEERRNFPVVDVIDALLPLSQPELLQTSPKATEVVARRKADNITGAIVAPVARIRT